MTAVYLSSVIDSYTGLPWCGRALHLLEEGKNANRRTDGTLLCLPCAARLRADARKRDKRARLEAVGLSAADAGHYCTETDCTDRGPYATPQAVGAHRRCAHGAGQRKAVAR